MKGRSVGEEAGSGFGFSVLRGVGEGHVLRPINHADQVRGERMSEKVVWQLLQPYAAAGILGISPHGLQLRSNVPRRRWRA